MLLVRSRPEDDYTETCRWRRQLRDVVGANPYTAAGNLSALVTGSDDGGDQKSEVEERELEEDAGLSRGNTKGSFGGGCGSRSSGSFR